MLLSADCFACAAAGCGAALHHARCQPAPGSASAPGARASCWLAAPPCRPAGLRTEPEPRLPRRAAFATLLAEPCRRTANPSHQEIGERGREREERGRKWSTGPWEPGVGRREEGKLGLVACSAQLEEKR